MHDVVKKLETLAKVERRISVKILRCLIEVEKKRIHLDIGYSSLFVFLTKHLKYSDGSAYRRIEAMKILRDVPDLGHRITVGAMSVTTAAEISRIVKTQKIKDVEAKQNLVEQFSWKNKREVEKEIARIAPCEARQEKLREINPEESSLELTVSRELREKLEKLKALLSHKNPSLKMSGVLEIISDIALKQLEKRTSPKSEVASKAGSAKNEIINSRATSPKSETASKVASAKNETAAIRATSPEIVHASNNQKRSRYIPVQTKRIIFQRAKHQCEFTTPNNKRCEAKHFLEVDHKHPYSQGGGNETQNLQLLCRKHNQRKAELKL